MALYLTITLKAECATEYLQKILSSTTVYFLDAPSHLYEWVGSSVCLYLCKSFRISVCPSHQEGTAQNGDLSAEMCYGLIKGRTYIWLYLLYPILFHLSLLSSFPISSQSRV